jgi:hypothetical protein
MVDGMSRRATVCTLSHWPGTPTPPELWDDVSAGIVLRALGAPGALPAGVDTVSIDHYDEDGVIALALLCVEGLARRHGPLLVEAARVGDFGVVRDRDPALVAFALAALADAGPDDVMERCARSARRALALLPALADDPGAHSSLWADEVAAFDGAREALHAGWAAIEERPRHDLAIVRVDTDHPDAARAAWEGAPLHRAAVHSATGCLRVATLAGGRFELRYRYESWVRLASRRPRPRVDLSAAASMLTGAETDGARWTFDGAGAITGALHLVGEGPSSLDPDHFVDVVCGQLATLDAGPPAWDPYAVPVRAP